MKKIIEELNKERETIRLRMNDIDDAIYAFQKVCKHKDDKGKDVAEFEGFDGHRNNYICSICGKEFSL